MSDFAASLVGDVVERLVEREEAAVLQHVPEERS